MSHLENYYKYYNLSGVPARILKGEEHYNLYKKPLKEKSTERPKVIVWKPNATHQADLAEMPVDPKGFHYFLVVVEVAGKRVDAEPLKDKTANRVLNGFVKIYRRNRIKPPTHRLETDSGSEFTNDQVRDFFLNSLGVMMRFGEPGRHKQQSYAERAIQAIQEPLLKRMVAQELKTGVTSVEWSEDFHNIVSKVNELWQRNPPDIPTGSPKVSKKTDLLSEGARVRVKLDEPISVLGVSRCAYTRKELQVVPINEKPPPDSVIRGQPERFIPEQILRHRIRKGQDQYLVKWERYPDTEATWEPADRLKEDVPDLIRKFWE
ncbi:DDE-type integrase/transposase/recombinase [Rhizophagus irregularis DAOM 181602=DAOM 197198]|nr:DDE-type integrase/transposase/recombinase [Rhizophagus irregularis DAOM 181602=DAOM 197198]GBC50740.2 DDE-type integrase/transposase/recombinase [Rhizophagus irregularis DAOM 181602=DAOM 197198]GET54191.1 DDE-type integrase/transposase/recombinase [Rhizophagus irregularis DAOM 181602=DAOM 197198]GET54964.1 DDE-type integrase/transposase/recombinase [Rhizophagus irregularis DAOM 181602=DAOM 197198]